MYSLPITTYSDYWRATKTWSSYLGGLAVFAAGTRYSTLNAPDIPQTSQLSYQQIKQPQTVQKSKLEISLLDSRKRILHVENVSRGGANLSGGNAKVLGLEHDIPGKEGIKIDSGQQVNTDVSDESAAFKDAPEEQASQGSEKPGQTSPNSGRMTSVIEIVDKETSYETQVIESENLLPGMSKVQEQGEKGILRQVVKTFNIGGQPVDQQIQLSFELKSPKKKVVIRNSKPAVGESFDINNLNISKTITVESTAYTFTGNKTATGLTPRQGIIAVDPRVIAMGSKVYVEGYGYAIAADTGGDIKGNRVDVFFTNLRQCIDWGRKPVRIHVLKPI
jgi:3D (Asp-Asp-Asp) domain-containing protein